MKYASRLFAALVAVGMPIMAALAAPPAGSVVIIAADPDSGQLELDNNRDGSTDVVVRTSPDTRVSIGPTTLGVEQLPLLTGFLAEVAIDAGSGIATSVHVSWYGDGGVVGTVAAIDPDARALTVENGDVSVELVTAAGAEISVAQGLLALADLEEGDEVTVHFVPRDERHAIAVAIDLDERPLEVAGLLRQVTASSINLSARGRRFQLRVGQATELRLNGQPADLADMAGSAARRPLRVTASYLRRRGGPLALRLRGTAGQGVPTSVAW